MALRRALVPCLALSLLAACGAPPAGPRPLLAPAYARYVASQGKALLPGSLVGLVHRLEGERFVPAAGATVVVDEGALSTRCDADGAYGFEGLAAGPHRLDASLEGHGGFRLQVVLNQAMGLPRANLLVVPKAGGPALAGVVVDPRGAAVPQGVVEAADAPTGARLSSIANGDGLYRVALPESSSLPPRLVNLSGHGLSPGGVKLDASRVQELSLTAPASVALGLDAFAQASEATWVGLQGRQVQVQAQGLPGRADELVLRWEDGRGAFEAVPIRLSPPLVEAELPVAPLPGGKLELRVLGLVPPGQSPPSLSY